MSEHASQLDLDLLGLGALAEPDAARVRDHVASCASCQESQAAGAALQARYVASVMPQMLPRLRARTRPRRAWWLAAPVLAAAAIVVAIVARRDPGEPPRVAIKGDATLQVFAAHGDRVVQVRDGTRLAPGDRIRFVVTPGDAPYLLIGSVDGAGAATIYYPYNGTSSARTTGDRKTELDGSIVLDATPGPERVFALFTSEPLAADDVKRRLGELGARGAEAIRSTRGLDLAVRAQVSVVFEKAPP